ncbi:MAG: N-acetyltransferase family protein, partial [Candidatus Nanohaloarchaea archaeon]
MLTGEKVEEFDVDGRNVAFRYPVMEDVDELLEMINSLVEEGAPITRVEKLEREDEVEWLSNVLEKMENGRMVYLVVEVDGKVRGSAEVEREDEPPKSHLGRLGISLREEIRGKGIGTRLMKTVMSEAQEELGIETVILEVFESNEPAKNLYEKVGFREAGRVEDGIKREGKYEDYLIMQKEL